MYCRNCGKELLENDNFCPVCGTKVEKTTQESREIVFDPDTVPETKENFDFKWDLDDFNRQQRKTEDAASFDWGDLLGVKKEKTVDERISEASRLPGRSYEPISDFVFEPSAAAKPAEHRPSEKFGSREDDFYTFSKKNAEFQELLNKEHERVKKAKQERALRLEELDLDNINREIVLDEQPAEPEQQPETEESGLAKRRRKRKEAEQTEYIPVVETTQIPLKVDEDDISGQWPEEPAADTAEQAAAEEPAEEAAAVQPEEAAAEHQINQIEEMARARELLFNSDNLEKQLEEDTAQSETPEKTRVATQQISRDQFAEFLKKAEEQFGVEALDQKPEEDYTELKDIEDIMEELPDAEEPAEAEQPAEPVIEEPAQEPESPAETAEHITEDNPEEPAEETAAPAQPEEAAAAEPPKKKRSRKVREETGEFHLGDFKDDNFWSSEPEPVDEDEEYDEPASKGGRAATVAIVILSVILALLIAMMIIRFQFPESAAAEFIEPKITTIENWIRGIFS